MSSDSGFECKTHWFRCKTNSNLESYIRIVSIIFLLLTTPGVRYLRRIELV